MNAVTAPLAPPVQTPRVAAPAGTDYVPRAGDMLPDIVPLAPTSFSIQVRDGVRLLQFATTTANLGAAALEVSLPHGAGPQPVQQSIRNADGSLRHANLGIEKSDGEMTIGDFATYHLFKANPDGSAGEKVVDNHDKVAFLIIDTDKVAPQLDPNGLGKVDRRQPGRTVQGISVGAGDTYGPGLCGQNFDIGSLSEGTYVVRQVMDPNNRFAESNEGNNIRDTLVTIDGDKVTNVVSLGAPRQASTDPKDAS